MKIEIEVEDIKDMFCGLNNALILYRDDTNAKFWCCESNMKLEKIPYEKQKHRFDVLKKFYDDIYEKYKEEIDNH